MQPQSVSDKLIELLSRHPFTCPVCKGERFETGKIYDPADLRFENASRHAKENPENIEAVCTGCGYVFSFKVARMLNPES